MAKDIRTTIYLNELLSKNFRNACSKKFGDKQGKIKQGYEEAISDFCNKVLELDQVQESPDLLAKKLKYNAKRIVDENISKPNVKVDKQGTYSFDDKLSSDDIEAKAKKLAEDRKKDQQDSTEHQVLT